MDIFNHFIIPDNDRLISSLAACILIQASQLFPFQGDFEVLNELVQHSLKPSTG